MAFPVLGAITALGQAFLGNKGNRAPRTVLPDPTDPTEVTARTIAGNRGLLPSATNLASDATRDAQGIASANIERALPGFTALRDRFLAEANANLDDPYALPAGVQDNLSRLAAERGRPADAGPARAAALAGEARSAPATLSRGCRRPNGTAC